MPTMVISATASATATETAHQTQAKRGPVRPEVESVRCESCGFTEECTPAYIRHVRDRYKGHWLCGLCAEAVKDEVVRSPTRISTEEALRRHISFCHTFRSRDGGGEEEEHPISAMGRILRRSLDSCNCTNNTPVRTSSSGALPGIQANVKGSDSLARSGSCFPALSR